MNETNVTERLDERGLLHDARGPGCYALALDVPDDVWDLRDRWDGHHDARPPNDALARLATAERVAYVGASGDVYGRLCDHCAGDVRQASILQVCPPVRVVDVWPTEEPFEAEFNRGMRMVREGWVCWTDGTVLG